MAAAAGDRVPILLIGQINTGAPIPDFLEIVRLSSTDELSTVGARIRGLALGGKTHIDADMFRLLPHLEIIGNCGVGYDHIDVAAAKRAGAVVTNTPDVLTEEVADLALGLLIATTRSIPAAERFLRSGAWAAGRHFPLSASLRGRRIGIVGMGRIGRAIARRCEAMLLPVSYFNRSRKADLALDFYPDPVDLARQVDVLILTLPGSSETDKLIGRDVLAALGPDGIVINVGRGSVVDQAALIEALRSRSILAAGLDVYEDEPHLPPDLLTLDNAVLLPHIGSASTTTRNAMGDLVFANLRSWFSGQGALTPV